MERVAWTDERLDDLSARMDAGFARVDRDIRDLRGEMHAGFADLRGEIETLRSLMLRMGGGIVVTVVVATFLGNL
jgi:hypothetical protein